LTEWASTSADTSFIALAAAASVISASFTSGDPETLIRAVGLLSVQSDQVAAAERPFGAIGLAVVSDQAFAIGVTAVPTPYTDAASDLWAMHAYWAAPMAFGDATGFANIATEVRFDSKAMRKISPDQTLVLVVENGNTAHGCFFRLDARILSKVA